MTRYISYKDVMSLVGQKRFDGRTFREGDELAFTHEEIVERMEAHGFVHGITRTEQVGRGTDYYAELTRLGAAMINEWEPEKFRTLNRRAGNYVKHVRKRIDHEHRFAEDSIEETVSADGSEVTLTGTCLVCNEEIEDTFSLAGDGSENEPEAEPKVTA
jgi:hypothetical protein